MRLLSIYLRSAAVFIGLTLLLNVAADALGYRWLNWRSDDLKGFSILPVYQRFSEQPDLVFLGTSHSRAGIIPLRMQIQLGKALGRDAEVWNLGIPGGNLRQLPQLLEVVFAQENKPAVLLVESDVVYWRHQKHWEVFNQAFEDVLGTGEADPDESTVDAAARWLKSQFYGPTALWRQTQRLISKQARERAAIPKDHGTRWTLEMLAADWAMPGPFNADLLRRERLDPAVSRPGMDVLEISEQRDAIFKEVVQRCAAEGVQLVLWRPPVTAEYEALIPENVRAEHATWIRERVEESGLLYLDFDTAENRQDESFRDLDHLDPSGADKIGKQLSEKLADLLSRSE